MLIDIKNIGNILREVFRVWTYRIIVLASTVVFLFFEIWLAHYSLLQFTFRNSVFTWQDKMQVLWSAVEMFFTIFPRNAQLFAMLTALLVGLNITMLIYYLRRQIRTLSAAGSSIAGIAVSILGVGCSACGSVILSSLIGFTAATQVLTFLPLQGKEFSLLAIGILVVSTYWIIHKIMTPGVCRIKK